MTYNVGYIRGARNISNHDNSQAFGRFLKFWRSVHKLSQEELAFRLDCSPRHISRLENGSSGASEALITDIATVLNMGQRDYNHLLIAAGFAPHTENKSFHDPDLKWLRNAMKLNLKALDPYPSVLMDDKTNILMVNKAWVGFYQNTESQEKLEKVANLYDFLFDMKPAPDFVEDWKNTMSAILMSIQHTALLSNADEDQAMLDRLTNYANVPKDWQQRAANIEPMASFRIKMEINGKLHSFFSVNNSVGALGPTFYASEPRLTINTIYPDNADLNLQPLVDKPLVHPKLFY